MGTSPLNVEPGKWKDPKWIRIWAYWQKLSLWINLMLSFSKLFSAEMAGKSMAFNIEIEYRD